MRLLLVNPNISDSVSDLIRAEARRSAAPGTEIEVLTAPFGVAYIETRFEAMVGAYAAAQVAAEHVAGYDAVVVAAFGDPGLAALREVLPVPVTGMTEAALASAHLLGHRISIIAISQRIQAWYREVVESYGFSSRLASIRARARSPSAATPTWWSGTSAISRWTTGSCTTPSTTRPTPASACAPGLRSPWSAAKWCGTAPSTPGPAAAASLPAAPRA